MGKNKTKPSGFNKLIVILIVIALVGGGYYYYKSTHTFSDAILSAKLKNASDLTTQKLIYTDVLKSSSGGIPILNKDNFLIKYTATVNAGFDVAKVGIDHNKSTVTVIIPHAKIQSINIDPDKIEFFDTNFSIIRSGKDAAVEAEREAKSSAEKTAKKSGLLEAADENSAKVIKAILTDSVGNRKIIVKYK